MFFAVQANGAANTPSTDTYIILFLTIRASGRHFLAFLAINKSTTVPSITFRDDIKSVSNEKIHIRTNCHGGP